VNIKVLNKAWNKIANVKPVNNKYFRLETICILQKKPITPEQIICNKLAPKNRAISV
jgi:hypothetical protein